jgi:tetraacyldisaccharide 4'-kinase
MALCGVGDPQGFLKLLVSLGARVEEVLSFPDHYWYTPPDLRRIQEGLNRVDMGVTTEKDAWKLREAGLRDRRVWALQVEADLEPMDLLWRHLRPLLVDS